MMWRSKDHRSAGLGWSLSLSGGGFGGHGRFLKSFQPLIITFCFSWCCRGLLPGIDLGGYGRFLGLFGHYFIFLVIFAAGDAAVDCFVTELAVDRWVIRRGPLGNSPWTTGWCGRPAFFLFSRLP
uniref:Uncharacterized protein n=1 Tax=Fagus sylvatica TaxID=28930 RepID=A0A2N9EG99_FAGSY